MDIQIMYLEVSQITKVKKRVKVKPKKGIAPYTKIVSKKIKKPYLYFRCTLRVMERLQVGKRYSDGVNVYLCVRWTAGGPVKALTQYSELKNVSTVLPGNAFYKPSSLTLIKSA